MQWSNQKIVLFILSSAHFTLAFHSAQGRWCVPQLFRAAVTQLIASMCNLDKLFKDVLIILQITDKYAENILPEYYNKQSKMFQSFRQMHDFHCLFLKVPSQQTPHQPLRMIETSMLPEDYYTMCISHI